MPERYKRASPWPVEPQWWLRAEYQRRQRELILCREAQRRLQQIEAAAHARPHARVALEPAPAVARSLALDSSREAATLSERLGTRGMTRLLLWCALGVVLGLSLVSFFTAPLMEPGIAMAAIIIVAMLGVAYAI